ncbi:MAG: 3-oxoacid CoA-transferase subunit A [Pseudomonadota bacterium]
MVEIYKSLADSVSKIQDGEVLMIGGFGGSGSPIELIHALIDRFSATGSPSRLTVVNNNAGNGYVGIAAMIRAGMVAKMICSFPRSSNAKAFNEKYLAHEIELELVPQGTLAERIRAGGAGIPAFYTPAGYGTEIADGKPTESFNGKMHVRELALIGDHAIVKADVGDTSGNLTFRMAARNFSPLMCMASKNSIVQVRHLVSSGQIKPANVMTPGIFVSGLIEVPNPEQEELLVRKEAVHQ